MRKFLWAALGVAGIAAGVVGCSPPAKEPPAAKAGPKLQTPTWAYAVRLAPPEPKAKDDGAPQSLPGSTRRFTRAQIGNQFVPGAVPGLADWFPQDHPAMPKLVAEGDPARNIHACALCHLPNGAGRPENAGVAGLPKAYILRQLDDMAAGTRHSAEPLKTNTELMVGYAKAMTQAEKEEVSTYFASIPRKPWIKVVETATVPKMVSEAGLYVPLEGPGAGAEPIGARLIETPQDVKRSEFYRDPRSPFIAYAPLGSVAKGKTLAAGVEGRTLACAVCHGVGLTGIDTIPGLAGRSPSYIARQLNDFKQNARTGTMAPLMVPVVAKMTPEDMLDISAYIASLPPG
ncbi:MAG TPA: c-type cytochrome [Caulobacteraceae bacterium]|jgi:cytochrome c553|nr:c-type cytochrome [Caulobacteraceae bacterium]